MIATGLMIIAAALFLLVILGISWYREDQLFSSPWYVVLAVLDAAGAILGFVMVIRG